MSTSFNNDDITYLSPRNQVHIILHQNKGEGKASARHWKARGATVHFTSLNNHAGALDDLDLMKRSRLGVLRKGINFFLHLLCHCCAFPFTTLSILLDGRVTLCPQDWGPNVILGKASSQTLREIWNGKLMNLYRHFLWSGLAKESPIYSNYSRGEAFWGQ